jgi:enoyl-CoA hydratase/carnithine racemase
MSEHVIVTREGPRLKLLLNRPERRNAITVAMYATLADAIEGAAHDDSLRLITLEGAGQDFTAGNELSDFLSAPTDRGSGDDTPVWRVLRGLARNTVPIIAAVHGNAVGIGTTMLFHCDLIVAEEGSRFVMPFVDLGLVPEAASSLLFPRIAGRRAAARHLLLGEPFGVDEAERFGLVSHRAPAGGLDAALDRLVGSLLAKPAQALKLTQKLLRGDDQQAVLERMDVENGHFGERLTSDEVKEAITKFFAARANR